MMKLWSSLLVLVVAVLVAVSSVSAQEKKKERRKGERKRPSVEQMAERIFKKLDTEPKDKPDGVLTLEEFQASPRMKDKDKAKEIFEKIKKNKDGEVTVKEFTEWMKQRRAQHRKEGGKKREGRKHRKKGEKKEA